MIAQARADFVENYYHKMEINVHMIQSHVWLMFLWHIYFCSYRLMVFQTATHGIMVLTSMDDHTFDQAVVDDYHTVCIYM